jgi:transposase
MARATGLNQTAISRIWRAFSLAPHRSETFKLSTDPLFIDKVRDIVGLYMNPPERALVLCVDEKSQIQALDRTAPLLPMGPGRIERRSHDYKRHGTTSLFAALNTKTGRVIGQTRQRHRSLEFRSFLDTIENNVPAGLDVHLIMDNYGTHKTRLIHNWLARRPPLPCPLHAHLRLMAEPGGTLVRSAHRTPAAARRSPLDPGTESGHRRLHRAPQPRPQTLHLAQNRRPDPRFRRQIL